jgi:methylated-DNA-[protein]-cysteine S-methyltransferase
VKRKELHHLLRKVPKGMVTTYKEIARAAGIHPRYAGYLLHNNKTNAPCHRVVMSTGILGGYASGVEKKAELLQKEGVQIKSGKISHFDRVLFGFE